LRRHLYVAQMNLAQQAWAAGDLTRARQPLVALQPARGEEELRGFEWRWLWRRCQRTDLLYTFEGGFGDVAFSPDGRLLASIGKKLQIWEVSTRRLAATLPASSAIHNAAFS